MQDNINCPSRYYFAVATSAIVTLSPFLPYTCPRLPFHHPFPGSVAFLLPCPDLFPSRPPFWPSTFLFLLLVNVAVGYQRDDSA
eukprot:364234-Chlamydomonas_euryale.AAC.7